MLVYTNYAGSIFPQEICAPMSAGGRWRTTVTPSDRGGCGRGAVTLNLMKTNPIICRGRRLDDPNEINKNGFNTSSTASGV